MGRCRIRRAFSCVPALTTGSPICRRARSARRCGAYSGPTAVAARPAGGWLCVCGDWEGSNPAQPARLLVALSVADASGTLESETTVRDLFGHADPTLPSGAQTQLVDAHA